MKKEIKVWDILIRIFHWSLVITFFVSYLSGEEESNLHIYAGYGVLGLIIFRVIWGFIGTTNARFSQFVCSPKTAYLYFKAMIHKKPQYYVGHNPAGSWMILMLLFSLFVVTISGLKLYAIEEGKGPLAENNISIINQALASDDKDEDDNERKRPGVLEPNEEEEEFWEELHEMAANLTLLLVFLHIAGVIFASYIHQENLVKAMITGKKLIKDHRNQR